MLFGIPTIIVGENRTFQGPEAYLRSRRVRLEVLDSPECIRLMQQFIAEHPDLWNEDIGEVE
ncbi:MAG: hypothetical protein MK171_10770 [Pirellulales bacterium]|nr:hypothetical protein [Pirellulales bacterium]